MNQADLNVDQFSAALEGRRIDLVVTGSIGAVESVRFTRCLRRIGGSPTVWMTEGARQFTTETALAWASAKSVRTQFRGDLTHTATGDVCIVAPASSNFISKLVNGITDTAPLALVASYLGQGKKVLVLPNMHESLSQSPFFKSNLDRLSSFAHVLSPRSEEGKWKFPEPAHLADEVSHLINKIDDHQALIAFGGTYGYIDDVRYIGNYSSGALGTRIAEEAYRRGIQTHVVIGPCQISPKSYTSYTSIKTNQQLEDACLRIIENGAQSAVMAASVLDFIPAKRLQGKIPSGEDLEVSFIRTEKILPKIKPSSGIKVGFKLESELDHTKALAIAAEYMSKYDLSLMVLNQLSEVSRTEHKAYIVNQDLEIKLSCGKQAIANQVVSHLLRRR